MRIWASSRLYCVCNGHMWTVRQLQFASLRTDSCASKIASSPSTAFTHNLLAHSGLNVDCRRPHFVSKSRRHLHVCLVVGGFRHKEAARRGTLAQAPTRAEKTNFFTGTSQGFSEVRARQRRFSLGLKLRFAEATSRSSRSRI